MSTRVRYHADERDHAACAAAIRAGSRTFHAASLLLPARVRRPAYGLYAFCRLSDDAIDLSGGSHEALARLTRRLDLCYEGRPSDAPADRALADLVTEFAVPKALPEALLDGLAWDLAGRRFATLSELYDYSARVAGSVGAMMTMIMGVRAPAALARACDLGVAMQLTNIARDVGEDARNGRIYLPLDWLAAEGIDPAAFTADPKPSEALTRVLKKLLGAADQLYARAVGGVASLPASCRPAIISAAILYCEIGRYVERNGYDSVTLRARVPGGRKLRLVARALAAAAALPAASRDPALEETQYLVRAVSDAPPPAVKPFQSWWNLAGQSARMLEIYERLEKSEQIGRQGAR